MVPEVKMVMDLDGCFDDTQRMCIRISRTVSLDDPRALRDRDGWDVLTRTSTVACSSLGRQGRNLKSTMSVVLKQRGSIDSVGRHLGGRTSLGGMSLRIKI